MVNLHKRTKGSASGTLLMLLVAIVASLYLLVRFFMSFEYISPEDSSDISTEGRILPYGTLKVGSGIPVGDRDGEWVFENVCTQCHASDSTTLDSPKLGNEAEWAPRIAKGMEALLESATEGLNTMPARGGRSDLTDEELERAIVYMANQSGGNFPDPDAEEEEESGDDEAAAEGEEASGGDESATEGEDASAGEDSAAGEDAASGDGEASADGAGTGGRGGVR